ncbi:hypothetical protein [Flavobacterium cerinum]|uniref:Uncharacterized protein n=1 Tax=Flavobacterium cerinum TaxID=2502784 RepID=A0A3S3Q7H6_9FLAO|nr:hypothetical protein [Flavobacterium cerinum]RWW91778.1 hypothetical protein EPI11_18010 [Flavobacterium cerinum]
MSTETTIVYKLDNSTDTQTALKNVATETLNKLKEKFGNEYIVTAGDLGEVEKNWSHEIKVRKGNKIGAEVTLKWEQSQPEIVTVEVDDSSKMGSWITYGTLLPFVVIGAYLAYNDMAPLAFLPGQKVAAGLGGLIALIPGLIAVSILKTLLLKNEKEQNTQLVNEVRLLVTK